MTHHERSRVSLDAYDEQPRQEFVKCVVIGDTAVGKTRLICSYIFDQSGLALTSLYQRPHIPTVFAIDQYVIDPAVRKRAKSVVNGAQVQLRIWDTFGDHEKDRRFSFQNAHVVVLCFSIGSRSSLRNVNAKWYPEIKKYCPRAPIILVGTQLDRRHSDPSLFHHASQVTTLTDVLSIGFKGFLCKSNIVEPAKCIPPEVGRQTSREIDASAYLETSIVTKYGVNEVFENAIRAALIHRRQARALFSSYLKNIEDPEVQKPYLPDKLPTPEIYVSEKFKSYGYKILFGEPGLSDVTFLIGDEAIQAHSLPLMTSSGVLRLLFSHANLVQSLGYLAPLSFLPSVNKIVTSDGYINGIQEFNLPRGYHAIDIISNPLHLRNICIKVKNVAPEHFALVLEYLYTGTISSIPDIVQLFNVASYLQEESLLCYLSNLIKKDDYLNTAILTKFKQHQWESCRSLYQHTFYADVAFLVDDTIVPAHKQVLVSKCAMMAAMFKQGVFKESMMEQKALSMSQWSNNVSRRSVRQMKQQPTLYADLIKNAHPH